MPFADINGFRKHFQVNGPSGAPVLLLSNSLGTNLDMWAPQVGAWSRHYHVIRYDTRGHTQSTTPSPPYTIQAMALDALALLDVLGLSTVNFCGLSMGGMIGMWIAINQPHRLQKLVLANTLPAIGSPEIWNSRIQTVSTNGMEAIASQVAARWFTPEFRDSNDAVVRATETMLRNVDPAGYANCCAAIRDADLRSQIDEISSPTLIISGHEDPVIPNDQVDHLASTIPGSEHLRLAAAHLSNVEQPELFTQAVLDFLGANHA
jgi:3-oxoadipate enol-lactonase